MFDRISWIVCFIGVVSAVCIIANIVEAQVVTDGLVSYWRLDTIKGNTVVDVWGENDGTIFGDPKIAEGKIGKALNFDGDDHIVCGDDPSILRNHARMPRVYSGMNGSSRGLGDEVPQYRKILKKPRL